jgi:tetratricopeptide (TPR) repeat protein
MAQELIKTLNEFMEWVQQFDSGAYLFRGVPNEAYSIEASAFRRLKEDNRDSEKFLQINRALIRDARLQGYNEKDGRKLQDLEILAEFQHFGAATCLIDFTYNALIALWFACQSDSKAPLDSPKIRHGKVFAVKNEPPGFREITPELLGKEIGYFFQSNGNGRSQILQPKLKQLYQWQPRQQNHRIIAQQSIFLFGDSHFDADAECIILKINKQDILTALQHGFGITEAMLFPDFAGLARLRSEGRPYTELGASEYRVLASGEFQRGEYELAIAHYDKVINLDPDDAHTYYHRGLVYISQGQRELAIADYDAAISLKREDHAEFYHERGNANFSLKRYSSAIRDYNEVLRIFPNDGNCYYRRGLAKAALKQHELAIADYDEAIRKFPNYAEFYRWRGFAKYELEQHELAIADYNEAIRIYPGDRKSYYQRGLANFGLKEYELAISDYDKAIGLSNPLNMDPDDAYIYYQRGLAKRELNRFEEAIADFQTAFPLAMRIADDDPELAHKIDNLCREINSYLRGTSKDE